VRETGLVEVDPTALEVVMLPEPARLTSLKIRSGEYVEKGTLLGHFMSEQLDVEIERHRASRNAELDNVRQIETDLTKARAAGDAVGEQQYKMQSRQAREKADAAQLQLAQLLSRKNEISELKAPRGGRVIAAPVPDEVGKLFDRGVSETTPVFSVGDPARLIVRVPVTPPDYRVLRDDLAARGELGVSIHVKGRSDREFTGRVRNLPAQNAATVPVQLTQRGGGPLAVKPGGDPNVLVPLAQVYLVEVEILDPDAAIDPGQLAAVKIHAKWRSGAWWVGRAIANALDWGFY
jgi:putative peptide zinc metalloprotease protein